jgi:hypothetical protein
MGASFGLYLPYFANISQYGKHFPTPPLTGKPRPPKEGRSEKEGRLN